MLKNNDLIADYYKNGHSIRQIAKISSYSASKIRKILIDMNVKLRNFRAGLILRKKRTMPVSKKMMQVVEGELLGDGCLLKKAAQANFSFKNSKKQYADWLANIFRDNNIILNEVKKEEYYHKNWKKNYIRYVFSTLCSIEFTELESRWYNNRIKIVPEDLEISSISVLHWWLGDGTLPKKEYAVFCTDCFTKKEVSFLIKKLNQTIGLKSSLINYKNNYRIFIPKTSVPLLLEYIGPPPFEELSYKWNLNSIKHINNPIHIDYNYLNKLYITDNLTRNEIAKKIGCSKSLISKKLNLMNIRKDGR